MTDELCMELIKRAKEAADKNFCARHSGYTVGACLLTDDNKVYTAFNVENDGIMSVCAERAAFIKALTSGSKNFKAIAVSGKKEGTSDFVKTLPCGYCRQFMSEYASKDFIIISYDEEQKKIYKYTLEELLPNSFAL